MSLDYKKNKTLSKIGKILLPVLAACWMMVIFWFSAAPAPESSEMSYTVGIQIGKITVADFDAWTNKMLLQKKSNIQSVKWHMRQNMQFLECSCRDQRMHMVSAERRQYDMPGFGLHSMPRPMSFISFLYLEEAGRSGM